MADDNLQAEVGLSVAAGDAEAQVLSLGAALANLRSQVGSERSGFALAAQAAEERRTKYAGTLGGGMRASTFIAQQKQASAAASAANAAAATLGRQSGRAAAQATASSGFRWLSTFVGQHSEAASRAMRAPLRVMSATGKAVSRQLVATTGSFGSIARDAGPTAVAVTGIGLALGGLLSPLARFAAGLKVLQLSFGWADEAAQKTLTALGRVARYQPGLTGTAQEAAVEEERQRMEIAEELYGSGADAMQESITRKMANFQRGRGRRGEREAFARLGITPERVRQYEDEVGRIDLGRLTDSWVKLREEQAREMEAAEARGDQSAYKRHHDNLMQLGKDIELIGGTAMADVVFKYGSEQIAGLKQVQAFAARTGQRPGAVDSFRQYQLARFSLRTTWRNLKEDIAGQVQPAITGFLNQISVAMRDTEDGGQGLSRTLSGIAARMANEAWGSLQSILADIPHERVNGWLSAIEDWSKGGGPDRAADTIYAIMKAVGSFASAMKGLHDAGKSVIGIFETVRDWMNRIIGFAPPGEQGGGQASPGPSAAPVLSQQWFRDVSPFRPFVKPVEDYVKGIAGDLVRGRPIDWNPFRAAESERPQQPTAPVASLAAKTDALDQKIDHVAAKADAQAKESVRHAEDANSAQGKLSQDIGAALGTLSKVPEDKKPGLTVPRPQLGDAWRNIFATQKAETEKTQVALRDAGGLTPEPAVWRTPSSPEAIRERMLVDRLELHDEEIGLNAAASQKAAAQLQANQKTTFEALKALPSEAPEDGKAYVRRNRAWSELVMPDGAGGGAGLGGGGGGGGADAGGGASLGGGADTGAGSVAPGPSTAPISNAGLASQRAQFRQEVEQNPNLRRTWAELMNAEQSGAARQSVGETMVNRAAAWGTSLAQQIDPSVSRQAQAYYEPYQTGAINRSRRQLAANPSELQRLYRIQDEILAGSNRANLATHNASAGVAASARRTQTVASAESGETYTRKDVNPSVHGAGTVAKERAWYQRTLAAMRSAPQTASSDPGLGAVRENTRELVKINQGVTSLGQPQGAAGAPGAAEAAGTGGAGAPGAQGQGPQGVQQATQAIQQAAAQQPQPQTVALKPPADPNAEFRKRVESPWTAFGPGQPVPPLVPQYPERAQQARLQAPPQSQSSLGAARNALAGTAAGRAFAVSADVQQTAQGPVLGMRMDQRTGAQPATPDGTGTLAQMQSTQANTQELKRIGALLPDFQQAARDPAVLARGAALEPQQPARRPWQPQPAGLGGANQLTPQMRPPDLGRPILVQPERPQAGQPGAPGERGAAGQSLAQLIRDRNALPGESREALNRGVERAGELTGLTAVQNWAREGRLPESTVPQMDVRRSVATPAWYGAAGGDGMSRADGEAFGAAAASSIREGLNGYSVALGTSVTSQSVPPRSVPAPTGGDMPTEA